MRLTLRTLLAYLDDTLEPSQARLIGQKVAESDAAQELIARTKQVTRRRRLTSPPATGPGSKLDPNLIAEYLDNVLSPEQLAEVEETCLGSDTHLAEVAASHQILTLVLGEPALVPPTARQRMYGLIRGREAIPNRKAITTPIGQGSISSGVDDEADDTLLLGLSLSRPGTWLRWLLPLLASCLLIAAGLAIWMAISPGVQPIVPGTRAFEEKPPVLAQANYQDSAGQAVPAEKKTEPDQAASAEKKKADEQKKSGSPAQKTEPDSKVVKGPEKPDETAKKDVPPVEAKPESKPPSVMQPRTDRRELARMMLAPNWPSVLLQRSSERPATWQRLKPESRVYATDTLMSLPGYRSELRTDSGVQLLLWGSLPPLAPLPVLESMVVLYQNPDFDLDLKLDRGLVVLTNLKEAGPAHVRLRFHDEVWDLTLPDRAVEVGVELAGAIRPYTKESGGGEPGSVLTLYVFKGQADLRIRYRQLALTGPCTFNWDNNRGSAAGPRALPRPPDWWSSKLPPREAQGIETALKALANRLVANGAIDVVLGELLHDTDAAGAIVAIHSLGAVEDWSKLLDALSAPEGNRRILTIYELRYLLGLDARNDQKLLQALKTKNYKEGQAQAVLELLHGYSEEDWANPETRAAVVDYLMSDKLAVRQLTHFLLFSLVPQGRKITYDAAGDVDQRERGYLEWRKAVLNYKPPAKPKG